jgi:hypothetical protein
LEQFGLRRNGTVRNNFSIDSAQLAPLLFGRHHGADCETDSGPLDRSLLRMQAKVKCRYADAFSV